MSKYLFYTSNSRLKNVYTIYKSVTNFPSCYWWLKKTVLVLPETQTVVLLYFGYSCDCRLIFIHMYLKPTNELILIQCNVKLLIRGVSRRFTNNYSRNSIKIYHLKHHKNQLECFFSKLLLDAYKITFKDKLRVRNGNT